MWLQVPGSGGETRKKAASAPAFSPTVGTGEQGGSKVMAARWEGGPGGGEARVGACRRAMSIY